MLSDALDYLARGWSIIPIRPGTKRPACRSWEGFEVEPATESIVKAWFPPKTTKGIAVICGPVSHDLTVRDFDSMPAYNQWAGEYPTLAKTLPTVETARGRHVYCRSSLDRIVKRGDGEVRGNGCVLLPPSKHPSGPPYRWLIPLGDSLPFLDVIEAGFLIDRTAERNVEREAAPECNRDTDDTEETEEPERQKKQKPLKSESKAEQKQNDSEPDIDEDLMRLIVKTLPMQAGERNKMLFDLCRLLKGWPAFTGANVNDLKPLVRRWHDAARPVITSKAFLETWRDFVNGWPKVRWSKGDNSMSVIVEAARASDIPPEAADYDHPDVLLLVKLCRELQRASGNRPFFLSTRTAGELLGCDHTTASRWLKLLVHDELLKIVELGNQASRRATRFRYLGTL